MKTATIHRKALADLRTLLREGDGGGDEAAAVEHVRTCGRCKERIVQSIQRAEIDRRRTRYERSLPATLGEASALLE